MSNAVCSFCGDQEAEHPKKVFIGSNIDKKTICADCVREIRAQLLSAAKSPNTQSK